MTETVIRLAARRDAPGILKLARLMAAENGLFDMDEALVNAMMDRAFDRKGGIIGVVGDDPDNLQACIALEITHLWYTREVHLGDTMSFVHPDHRNSDYARALLRFAKTCAVQMQVPLMAGIVSNERTEAKVRLYSREVGYPVGAFFIFNGDTKDEPSAKERWEATWDRGRTRGGRNARRRRAREQTEGITAHG